MLKVIPSVVLLVGCAGGREGRRGHLAHDKELTRKNIEKSPSKFATFIFILRSFASSKYANMYMTSLLSARNRVEDMAWQNSSLAV